MSDHLIHFVVKTILYCLHPKILVNTDLYQAPHSGVIFQIKKSFRLRVCNVEAILANILAIYVQNMIETNFWENFFLYEHDGNMPEIPLKINRSSMVLFFVAGTF